MDTQQISPVGSRWIARLLVSLLAVLILLCGAYLLRPSIRARYLVDGTGHRSILAERVGLRETPTRLKHHSRTLFTHMVDVPPFDDANNPLPISYHKGTLHHCFERTSMALLAS